MERPARASPSSSWAGRRAGRARVRGRARARPCSARRTRSWRRRSPRSSAGARVEFVDCNREDLCMSFEDFEAKAERHRPTAAWLVHIGGHIAFDVERIAALLPRARHLPDRGLRPRARRRLERPHGRAPGATRASTRCTRRRRSPPARAACWSRSDPELLEYARAYRNYGKPDHAVHGLNHRMSEFTAAIGLVQIERLRGDRRLEERGRARPARPAPSRPPELPEGMVSGLYKYIVFDPIERSTGQGLRRAVPPDPRHTPSTCRTPTGSPRTTGACRSTTDRGPSQ